MAQISSLTSKSRVEELVSQFLTRTRKPIASLKEKKTSLSRKSSVLTDLKSKLKTLRTRVKGFTDVGTEAKLESKTAVSSDESIFTVEADASANKGVSTILVSRIARNDIALTSQFTKTDTTLAGSMSGTQQFTIQIGSGTEQTVSFNVDASDTDSDVLSSIAEAINTSTNDVTAMVIASGSTTVRLSIVAKESGAENTITLSADSGNKILKDLGFFQSSSGARREFTSAEGGFITEVPDDLDAILAVNGIEITSSSNTITDVITGVTINLRKAQDTDSQPETLSISQDTDEIKSQITGFITDYNSALEYLTEKTKIETPSNTRGTLAGDFTKSE